MLQTNLHILTLLVVFPALLFLELASTATRRVHAASLTLLATLLLLLVAVAEYRLNGTAKSSFPSIASLAIALGWAIVAGKVIEGLQTSYDVSPSANARANDAMAAVEQPHVRIAIGSQAAQPRAKRFIKLIVATIGSTLVAALLLLLTANVAFDAYHLSAANPGRKILIDLSSSRALERIGLPKDREQDLRRTRPFRLHSGLESSPRKDVGQDFIEQDNKTGPFEDKPTALFFPPLASASGYVASKWLRAMVQRASHEPSDNGTGTADGHLALRRAVWYDSPGTGLSDYVDTQQDLEVQALAVVEALIGHGLVDPKSLGETDVQLEKEQQFILIALSSGSLVSNLFASHLPNHVHSQILIDAETVSTFYGDEVSPSSGLRKGYGARGRTSVAGRVWNDLLPAVLSPVKPCRLFAALLGETPAQDTAAVSGDKDSLSFRFISTICSPDSLASGSTLLTRLSHNKDASLGLASPNARRLGQDEVGKLRNSLLATRPTAVLSSFWKMMRDFPGWGHAQQDEIVKRAMGRHRVGIDGIVMAACERKSHLVGWWRPGPRSRSSAQEDVQGLCGEKGPDGKAWCQEAVRKVLAWEQATDGKNMTGRKAGVRPQ